ncbi:hypothetical protein [Alphaproteobacteria bacterium endosymbiont of Tiliacea citrago]|uniref:hypothetical protein n=1 Tax=Alphaproteobacteria bacterium endosymbiont of Tiliacea citrago TaxID=3077944 RepID=UPI00313DA042
MLISEIKSNIEVLNNFLEIKPFDGEPKKVISEILKKIEHPFTLISIHFVGRRFVHKDNLHLLKGRRFRIYFGLKINKKIYIKFGWHKIKNLNDIEFQNLKNNWSQNYFENDGRCLIEKSGGVLCYHNLIYAKAKISC